jgi:hypothetical protein
MPSQHNQPPTPEQTPDRLAPHQKLASWLMNRSVEHDLAETEVTVSQAMHDHSVPPEEALTYKVTPGYGAHEKDAAATTALAQLDELNEWEGQFSLGRKKGLLPEGETPTLRQRIQPRHKRRTTRIVDLATPEGYRRQDLLNKRGVELARKIVNVDIVHSNGPGALPEKERAHWSAVLDPANVRELRDHIVEKAVLEDVRKGDIVSVIQTGHFNKLYPNDIAAYLGISPKEWVEQRAGEQGPVPEPVLSKLKEIFSLPDRALTSLATHYHGAQENKDKMMHRDVSPLERLIKFEQGQEAIHSKLDSQITKARNAVSPYAYNPMDFYLRARSPRQQASENVDLTVLEAAGIGIEDIAELHARAAEKIKTEVRERAGGLGKSLSEEEYAALVEDISEQVVREAFVDDADEKVVHSAKAVLVAYHNRGSIRNKNTGRGQ